MDISLLPWLGPPAEMQDGSILHHPVHVAHAGASQEIIVIVPRVIVPDRVVDLHGAGAVHGVQDILIRQQQLFCMFPYIFKQFFRADLLPCPVKVDQKDAGVIIIVVFPVCAAAAKRCPCMSVSQSGRRELMTRMSGSR